MDTMNQYYFALDSTFFRGQVKYTEARQRPNARGRGQLVEAKAETEAKHLEALTSLVMIRVSVRLGLVLVISYNSLLTSCCMGLYDRYRSLFVHHTMLMTGNDVVMHHHVGSQSFE